MMYRVCKARDGRIRVQYFVGIGAIGKWCTVTGDETHTPSIIPEFKYRDFPTKENALRFIYSPEVPPSSIGVDICVVFAATLLLRIAGELILSWFTVTPASTFLGLGGEASIALPILFLVGYFVLFLVYRRFRERVLSRKEYVGEWHEPK